MKILTEFDKNRTQKFHFQDVLTFVTGQPDNREFRFLLSTTVNFEKSVFNTHTLNTEIYVDYVRKILAFLYLKAGLVVMVDNRR